MPYSDIDWSKAYQIKTTTHGHCTNQHMLDIYLKRGFEFLTISNYYPSAPTYPGKDVRNDRHRVRQDFPVMVNGNFYGAVFGDIVKFTRIAFDGKVFSAATDKPVHFELISKKGVVSSCNGTEFTWSLPSCTAVEHGYLRLTAKPESNLEEMLFTQAQMLCS